MKINFKLQGGIKNLIFFSFLVLLSIIIIPISVIDKPKKIVRAEDLKENDNKENNKEDSKKSEENLNKENEINENIRLEINKEIKVYLTQTDEIVTLNLNDYVKSVVSGEMPVSFESEALKAQSVAARTYATNKMISPCSEAKGADICDSTHCQVYISKEKRLDAWEEEKADEYWSKIEMAVDATSDQVLTYKDELVMYPQFFSTSSGKTENSGDVFVSQLDYLVSVESKGEEIAPKYKMDFTLNINEFIEKITNKYGDLGINASNLKDSVYILSRSEAGGVKEIKIGNEVIKGTELRLLLGLTSTNFNVEISSDKVIFKCTGYGHGVGMSQWGANVMGQSGKEYTEILKHYYTGVDIKKIEYKVN